MLTQLRTLALLSVFFVPLLASAQEPAAKRCAALKLVALGGGARVASTQLVGPGVAPHDVKLTNAQAKAMPQFCRVAVEDKPSADSDINTEVWLPAMGWNGRLRSHGNGGFAGNLPLTEMTASVAQGYATAGTDTGHHSRTADFALGHPEKVKDFGWRAVHDMTVEAKELAGAFYDKLPSHAYFTGCSDGGREALMEAQRFPDDYDGILAGAPAYAWTALIAGGAVDTIALEKTPLPAGKLPLIADAVRKACDAQDGVADGVIANPPVCHFDPAVLACKGGDAPDCLTAGEVADVKLIEAGVHKLSGELVIQGIAPGAEDAKGGLDPWKIKAHPFIPSYGQFFAEGFYRNFVYEDSGWQLSSFDLDSSLAKSNAITGAELNATDADLSRFTRHGGRLILYHGWNDPAIPALGTIAYWDRLHTQPQVDRNARLYLVPGMLHCGGGPGATNFGEAAETPRGDAVHDIFTTLEQWVEADKAPGTLTAEGNGVTRPLCLYPAVQTYVGGDPKVAASFTCRVPQESASRGR